MESRSTVSALIKVVDDWSHALDQGKEECVTVYFLTSIKPLIRPKVPHLPLLQQMEEINLNPFLKSCLRDYLSD